MTLKAKSIGFNVKAVDESTGSFSAYGNTFNNVDHANDKTMQGAFKNTIASWNAKSKMPRLLGQHGHQRNPIGIITEMKEDTNGLLFEGKFCLDTQEGREAYALVKMGAMDSFSIGYKTIKEKFVGGVNELHELDVKEISLVTFACNENSLIQSVKSAVETGGEITPRMIQKSLQEAGLSKRQAEAAVNAIKATDVAVADEMKTSNEAFKSKAASFDVVIDCEVKGHDMSLEDHARMVCRAAEAKIDTDSVFAYCEALYMNYVILCVCDYTGEQEKVYYVKLSYSISDDGDVMLGSPREVTKLVKWLTESELAVIEQRTEMAPETTDDYKEVEETPEVEEEEPTPEVIISDELKSVDIASWFNATVLEEVEEVKEVEAVVEEVKETTETVDFADWFK